MYIFIVVTRTTTWLYVVPNGTTCHRLMCRAPEVDLGKQLLSLPPDTLDNDMRRQPTTLRAAAAWTDGYATMERQLLTVLRKQDGTRYVWGQGALWSIRYGAMTQQGLQQ